MSEQQRTRLVKDRNENQVFYQTARTDTEARQKEKETI